jgi:carboxypeptidase family protein
MLRRMRAWIVAASLLIAIGAFGDEPMTFTVRGTVTFDGDPLPGCAVTLRGDAVRRVVAGVDGRYAFGTVFPGDYTLEFVLTGFKTLSREIRVGSDIEAAAEELEFLDQVETITVTCGAQACTDTLPETAYESPMCKDMHFDELLMEAALRGDPSAIEFAQKRFDTTFSYEHKHRIAASLLRHVPDDRAYWSELERHAADTVRFAYPNGEDPSPEFVQWCSERKLDLEAHHGMLSNAFSLAARDERANPLLHRALKTSDHRLVGAAITGLQEQHDLSALAEIGKAIARLPDHVEMLTSYLVYFQSDAADELALSLLDETGKANYRQQRDEYRASIVEYEASR